MERDLRAIARAAGLELEYSNWRGERVIATGDSVRQALAAIGPDLGIELAAPDALDQIEDQRWAEVIDPVVVAWDGDLEVAIRVVAEVDGPWQLDVITEDGRRFGARGSLFDLPADSHAQPRGRAHCVRRARLGLDGALGYHTLAWRVGSARGEAMVISAPVRAWQPSGPRRRRWGVFAPVYGLASNASGEAGDLGTLRTLMRAVEQRGGSYVATLPLLAEFFVENSGAFSPYSPASRLFWNELYLDLPRLCGAVGIDVPNPSSPHQHRLSPNAAAQPGSAGLIDSPPHSQLGSAAQPGSAGLIDSPPHSQLGSAAQPGSAGLIDSPPHSQLGSAAQPGSAGLIDFRAQYAWRRPLVDRLARAWLADSARRDVVFAWAAKSGAWDYAAFRALGEMHAAPWRSWPAHLRDGTAFMRTRDDAIASGADPARVDVHVFSQWAMEHQLEAFAGSDASLYLDLPVGVSMDAYEVWRWRRLFLPSLAAGAPPDALFLGGQNWSLPPLSPRALRRDRYRLWIDCVRRHMRVAGLLRIDHVMGLFRLYCVPEGRPATDGVYLRYPAEELLAILTLESVRARCALVGEDLGTVPDNVRPAMAKHNLYRLHVGQWHFPTEPGRESAPAPSNSVASLNTHDTATFAGWWTGADIADKRELGLIDEIQEADERLERASTKAAISATLPAGSDDDLLSSAMVAVTVELARSAAEVVLVSLDDVALERVPHNVPGTTTERPNWHRRVKDWETALDSEVIRTVAQIRSRNTE